jgi:hypothetical protein
MYWGCRLKIAQPLIQRKMEKLFHNIVFSWEEKLVAPLIAAPNGGCANKKTKDRAKKLDYRLRV